MARFTADDLDKLSVADDAAIDRLVGGDASEARSRIAALAEAMYCAPAEAAFSPVVIEGLARLAEFAVMTVAGFVLYLFSVIPVRGFEWPSLVLIPALAAGVVLMLQALGLYRLGAFRALRSQILRLSGGIALVCLAALLTSFILRFDAETARPFLIGWFGASVVAVLATRVLLSFFVARLSRTGRLKRRTVLVGGGGGADSLLRDLSEPPRTDLEILGIFDDRADDRSPAKVGAFRKLGTVEDLVEFARRTRVDLIIFTLPITAEDRILQMLRRLWILPIDIRLAAHMSKLRFHQRSYSYIGSVPLIDIFEKPLTDWDLVLKLCFDKIVGSFCLLLLSPIMLLVALAIKFDSRGPVFFKQKRYGFNNELIEVYKFRSMYVDTLDQTAARLVTRGDPRVTRVGRFIRKTSLDELPQLINVVFKGTLSLVGPRPHAVHAKAAEQLYDAVVDGYFARHRVLPGLTGWAQINGWRGETDTQEKIQYRVEHDLHYIENWSILFDIYILLKTPYALLTSDNAY